MKTLALATALACFSWQASAGPASAQRAAIYPSGPAVPENLLRIELRFDAPLRVPLDVDDVKLLDAQGHEIPDAFLDLGLPSADGQRVTLLMHPGRVKTGVGANERLGRALHPGETVTLVVAHPSLAHPVAKTWRVDGFDATPPQPPTWRVKLPHAGSREPIIVWLGDPISSTAEALIAVRDALGHRVPGRARLEGGETVWRFTPRQSWDVGDYAVVAHPDLEDPAGNRVCAAFEQVVESQVACDAQAELPFSVR